MTATSTGQVPTDPCDIVLKGGITSGVVYPLALVALSEKYRFANIGGTSAGAIAAAAAAAAEYGRTAPGGGFARLTKIPGEVGTGLLDMFQPTPALRPLLAIFLAAVKSGKAAALLAAIIGYWRLTLAGVLPGLAIVVVLYRDPGFVLFGLLLAVVGLLAGLIYGLKTAVARDLAASDFGLCPGITQPYAGKEGFTDWLARLIDEAAGRGSAAEAPLTFGDLATPPGGRAPIALKMMTTSLMERRPYTLPFTQRVDDRDTDARRHGRFIFEAGEFRKLFPTRIVDFLLDRCDPFTPSANEVGEFYYFPDEKDLPLVVAARMSLSFPGLISAVPLWVRDFTLDGDVERNTLRRCLFSDGGLSSNFPIHFFDRLLPNHPTFAISLDDYNPKRSRDPVWLPPKPISGIAISVEPFSGLFGFLMRLIDSAKDWQDNLQSTLPGYRERIVHIYLQSDEGGLNLAMDKATIDKLVALGKLAGETLREKFDMDAHRRSRFLVAMARMEETLDELADAYAGAPGGQSFAAFLQRSHAQDTPYAQTGPVWAAMLARGQDLVHAGQSWRTQPTIRQGRIPQPPTNLRITAKP